MQIKLIRFDIGIGEKPQPVGHSAGECWCIGCIGQRVSSASKCSGKGIIVINSEKMYKRSILVELKEYKCYYCKIICAINPQTLCEYEQNKLDSVIQLILAYALD